MKEEQIDAVSLILKSISNPTRLKILCLLQEKELSVGELLDNLNITNANMTQHLNILRDQGIITYRKEANYIYNKIADQRIIALMQTMKRLFCPE